MARMMSIDWTVPQYCLDCKRQMRRSRSENNGLPQYGSKGYCKTCCTRVGNKTLIAEFGPSVVDWSVPQHCLVCKREMTKRHETGSGKPSYGQAGKCNSCRGREIRVANGSVATYGQVFDADGLVCNSCKTHKPYTEYVPSTKSASGHEGTCKRCRRLRIYNLPPETYLNHLEAGTYVCQICSKTEEENGQTLSIDHDHSCCPGNSSCGKCFRGFLCNRCNWGIGHFEDSIELLDSAKAYLLKWEASKVADLN
jgi:hypothetical protein